MRRRTLTVALVVAAPFALAGCTATPPGPSPTATVTAAPIDLDTCLVGDWTADAGFANDFMEQLILERGKYPNGPTAARADGTISLSFAADGTFRYTPDITFEADFPVAGTQTGDVRGTATGTWQTLDGILLSTVEANEVVARISLGGELEPGAFGWDGNPIAVSEMSCQGDSLHAFFNLIETSFPIELTRAG